MHPYLEAAIRLEALVASGVHYQSALHEVCRAYSLHHGERELMQWAFRERRKSGTVKFVRPVEPQLKMPR